MFIKAQSLEQHNIVASSNSNSLISFDYMGWLNKEKARALNKIFDQSYVKIVIYFWQF